jgi:hypothetical protein
LQQNRIVKEREHRVRLELTLPHYGCGVLAAERPVLLANQRFAVGPEGLEPSPTWLRARHAAANTLIPSFVTRCDRFLGRTLAHSGQSRWSPLSSKIGAGRTRTLTLRIKSPLCCRYTTTPCEGAGAFESRLLSPNHNRLLCKFLIRPKKSLGVELNHRFRLIRATCFRYTTERCHLRVSFSRDGRNRTDSLVFPRHAGARCPSSRVLC